MNFNMLLLIGLLFGVACGYVVQRAGLCFAHGLGEIFMGKGSRICRLFSVIFIISGIGFLASGWINPELGLRPIGQLRGYGLFNLLSGLLFGAGILINGGCILGTLRQLGEGNMIFLVILISFIPGMALVVYCLNPWLESGYNTQGLLLTDMIPLSAAALSIPLCVAALIWLIRLLHGKVIKNT